MKKRLGVGLASLMGLVAAVLLFSALFFFSQSRYEPIDEKVEIFIEGKVEGNDDLLASVLSEKAEGIIKPGRHAYPGDFQKMGERYQVTRFSHLYKEGVMIYRVVFYRPSTGKLDRYNVLVLNKKEGWEIVKNSDVDEAWLVNELEGLPGEVVHRYEEVN